MTLSNILVSLAENGARRVVLRTLAVCAAALALGTPVSAQGMRDKVRTMPEEVAPLLTKDNKLDFVDFIDGNMKAEVTNVFGGKSEMTRLTADYASVRISGNSVMELKLLPLGADTVICVSKSYSSDSVTDSELAFYSSQWKSLPADMFVSKPSAADFIVACDTCGAGHEVVVASKIDLAAISASLSENAPEIVFRLTSLGAMDADSRKLAEPYVRKEVRMAWNGKRFE